MLGRRLTEQLFAALLPAGLDEEEADKASVFITAAVAGVLCSLLSAVMAALGGLSLLALYNLFTVLVFCGALGLFRRFPRGRRWISHLVFGSFTLAVCLGTLSTQPLDMSNQMFLFVVPLASAAMHEGRAAWFWTWASLLASGLTIFAGHAGYVAPQVDPTPAITQTMNFVFALLVGITFVHAFWRTKQRHLERLQQATEARRRFFANVGHDLRTPMNGVLGLADALAQESLTPRQHEMVDAIRSSGAVLVGLLNDLLELSRGEAGRLEVRATPVGLQGLAQELIALWRPFATSKGLNLDLALAPGLPPALLADGVKLRQVLNNLVSNGLKFTAVGGVRVLLEAADGQLVFSVSDSGPGIPEAQRDRLFQPFTHVDDERTRRFRGAGLGLAASAMLCKSMGGTLALASHPGQGSTFRVALPLRVAPVPAPTPQAGPAVPTGLRALVVDDNAVNRLVARRLLEARGCDVTVAEDGAQAVALAQQDSFDVVLMDLAMPVMDGLAATRRLRAHGYQGHIVGLSASASLEDMESCLAAGMNDFVAKPLRGEALLGPLLASRPAPPAPQPSA